MDVAHSVDQLRDDALRRKLTRRDVLRRGASLGLAAPAIAALLTACGGSAASSTATSTTAGAAGAATPAVSGSTSNATPAGTSTSAGTQAAAATKRGEGSELKLLWWQAPTILNGHLAVGTTDTDAARVVGEPLADFDHNGNLVPLLADHAPTLENGVAWKLKQGVKWSDGQPFTSADVKFTYEYVSNPDTAATTIGSYDIVEAVDTPDDYTAVVHFKNPAPNWTTAFCGVYGFILPQHILKDYVGKAARNAPFNLKPIGTGAFKVDTFKPGDSVQYSANENYRDPTKPYFATVNLKGGGDATSAARAAIQTAEVDYAWNLQVSADILKSLQSPNSPGELIIAAGTSVEMILVNMSDPNKTVDGQRSHLGTPHPFQAELNVRKAYALLVQRDVMASRLYGSAGAPTANVLVAPPRFASKNTSWKYDIDRAEQILDRAGWKKGSDGIRAKNGVKMQITFQTTVNTLRQQEQEIIKAAFEQAGIKMTLKSVDAGVFFSSDAGNPDTLAHFCCDLEMFTNGPGNPYPIAFMRNWWGDPSNIAQQSNQWSGSNNERWRDADYDKLYEQALTEIDPSKQPALFVGMNDLVVNQVVRIPEVLRNGVSGASRKLENINLQTWTSSDLWNLANWTRKT